MCNINKVHSSYVSQIAGGSVVTAVTSSMYISKLYVRNEHTLQGQFIPLKWNFVYI